MTPNWHTQTSTEASAVGRSCASACCHRTRADPDRAAPRSTMGGARSVAVMSVSGSRPASSRVRAPVPAATSRTRDGAHAATRSASTTA